MQTEKRLEFQPLMLYQKSFLETEEDFLFLDVDNHDCGQCHDCCRNQQAPHSVIVKSSCLRNRCVDDFKSICFLIKFDF